MLSNPEYRPAAEAYLSRRPAEQPSPPPAPPLPPPAGKQQQQATQQAQPSKAKEQKQQRREAAAAAGAEAPTDFQREEQEQQRRRQQQQQQRSGERTPAEIGRFRKLSSKDKSGEPFRSLEAMLNIAARGNAFVTIQVSRPSDPRHATWQSPGGGSPHVLLLALLSRRSLLLACPSSRSCCPLLHAVAPLTGPLLEPS